MFMFRFAKTPLIIAVVLVASLSTFYFYTLQGATKSQLSKRITDAKRYFQQTMEAPDSAIPSHILKKAKAIIILRQYKAGFIFGGKGGYGIVVAKDPDTHDWSPPAFVKSGEGSIGFQIGGQSVDSIFVIMNKEGLDILRESRFKIGVDASAAAGPVGRDAEAKVGPETAILAYSRARGLYAGVSIEGGILFNDTDANDKFYGEDGLKGQDILFENAVNMPDKALPLVELLEKHAS